MVRVSPLAIVKAPIASAHLGAITGAVRAAVLGQATEPSDEDAEATHKQAVRPNLLISQGVCNER